MNELIEEQGFTNASLIWKSWLPLVDKDTASSEQLSVLKESHPRALVSEYYLTLAHQPEILRHRSLAFNAIMYAPGGLSRAERELASVVVSRVNRCVYCASVHAQRYEQLAKRNSVIAQVFADPWTAGDTDRERAIIRFAIALTLQPAGTHEEQVRDLRAQLSDGEILDLVHVVAIFAWANRLMLNLGEPQPDTASA
ncbi:peroxidase-related enzyme [Pseudomonas sp. Marseille-P9899]|uniref:peroxidase-related enzyme n=1 Tax=Pseudomonas sp. Marseille-P9899 TaxID=2730401 RepID=UPI00158CBE70|nr:peroxidase-related enzyme [Pseudomonas sp. Marseille-P9899]